MSDSSACARYRCNNGAEPSLPVSKNRHSSTVIDCPWDTIKMQPKATVEGMVSSIEANKDRNHPVFADPNLVEERVGAPLKGRPVAAG